MYDMFALCMLRKVLAAIFTALAAHLFDGTRLFKDSLKEKGRERQQSPRAVSQQSHERITASP
jgi:hypothetical protein